MAQSLNHRAIRWLRGELPDLVSSGVITAENAAAIDRHYEAAESRAPDFGFIILAAIGSTLVGAGIILLIAHNWDDLSRPVRCVIAFVPLIIAQLLGGFSLLRRNESAAWRESVAILDVAAVATAISLVSQTFQIQGNFADFMRLWLLLSIPIIYLFRTTFGALAYIAGTAVWMVSKGGFTMNLPGEMFFWILLVLVIPFYVSVVRRKAGVWTFRVLSVALIGAVAIGLGETVGFTRCDVGAMAFAGFVVTIYMCGMARQAAANESLNILSVIGGLGIAATAVVLSFEGLWHLHSTVSTPGVEQILAIVVTLLFPLVAIGLAAWCLMRRTIPFSLSAAALPIVAVVARLIAGAAPEASCSVDNPYAFAAAMLFNVYALVLGLDFLVRGIRAGSVARANFGLLVIAALALARFFDSDLSFVARGIGFTTVGAAFLIGNVVFFRKHARA